MLAVHWSPVKNTKAILRNGIHKSSKGLFCFPLTGNPNLDKWWAKAFRRWGVHAGYLTAYNGFVFRIVEDDLPAAFSHWLHGPDKKPMNTISEIQAEFDRAVAFRIGENHFGYSLEACVKHRHEFESVGQEIVARNPERYLEVLDRDPGFLEYIFEDYQIVLSRSITPSRIMRVMYGGSDYGRNIARVKKEKSFRSALRQVD